MVQSLPPTLPATGPGTVTVRPSVRPINTDKHDEFRHFLHSLKEPLAGPAAGDQASVPEPRQGPREEREITVAEDWYRALAPGEQSSFGRANPDPSEWLAVFTSTGGVIEAHPAPAFTSQAPELSELVEGWVRRVAVGGDQRRAVARLDIGHGQFAGAELLITAEGRRVSVELTLPKGAGAGGLSERLSSRLAARGYAADVEVR
jgi:hypothetical protein